MSEGPRRKSKARTATSPSERFKGLGSTAEIVAKLNRDWWSIPLAMRVLRVDKPTLDWMKKTGILTIADITGIKSAFRDDVLAVADTTVEQLVAEVKGDAIPDGRAESGTREAGLEHLLLTRSQWDFYFRRRLAESGIDAPIYTKDGLQARCPFCQSIALDIKLPAIDGLRDVGRWLCHKCKMWGLPNDSGTGVDFEILLNKRRSRQGWIKLLIAARANIQSIAQEAVKADYKSPDAPAARTPPDPTAQNFCVRPVKVALNENLATDVAEMKMADDSPKRQ